VQDDIYKTIALYLKDYVISSPSYKAVYNEEQRALIELLYSAFDAKVDPNGIINAKGKKTIFDLLSLDLDSLPPFASEKLATDLQNPPIKIDTTQVICRSFSNHKDLSDDYNYANPVHQYTCSHKVVDGNICVLPSRQSRCPYYSPDFNLHATYTLVQNSEVYFNVYKHRSVSGFSVYTIYDNKNNLIHNLSYDSNTVYDNSKEDFNDELESIVLQTYSYVDKDAKFYYRYHNQKSEVLNDSSKSYIATLVSIS
jgi:hypothetical protein